MSIANVACLLIESPGHHLDLMGINNKIVGHIVWKKWLMCTKKRCQNDECDKQPLFGFQGNTQPLLSGRNG